MAKTTFGYSAHLLGRSSFQLPKTFPWWWGSSGSSFTEKMAKSTFGYSAHLFGRSSFQLPKTFTWWWGSSESSVTFFQVLKFTFFPLLKAVKMTGKYFWVVCPFFGQAHFFFFETFPSCPKKLQIKFSFFPLMKAQKMTGKYFWVVCPFLGRLIFPFLEPSRHVPRSCGSSSPHSYWFKWWKWWKIYIDVYITYHNFLN